MLCTDGTGHGGAIGIFIEGGVHDPSNLQRVEVVSRWSSTPLPTSTLVA